jgi:hypothetical protein
MRDGVELGLDLTRPDLPGPLRVVLPGSLRVVLSRTSCLNKGAENVFKDDAIIIADQWLYHEQGLASCVVLPVVRRQ